MNERGKLMKEQETIEQYISYAEQLPQWDFEARLRKLLGLEDDSNHVDILLALQKLVS